MSIKPYVEIVEQPARNGTRFRYECEGKYKGIIRGVSGEKNTYPTIRVVNYNGPATVVVSCVTATPDPHSRPKTLYRPHPHKLSHASQLHESGACFFDLQPNTLHHIVFSNLSVQCCAKKNIDSSLQERQKAEVDPFQTGFDHRMTPRLIDLNCIRLCFHVFIKSADPVPKLIPLAPPVVSDPIFDKKSMGELKICWMSHNSATADGGTVVCLLCEKVSKTDVEVIFTNADGSWQALASYATPEVFRQVSIVFRTPAYASPELLKEPVEASVKIRRPSTNEYSEPRKFLILPSDKYIVAGKRKRYESKSEMCELLQMEMVSNSNRLTADEPMVCGVGKIEPWELPPMNEFSYLQPQVQYQSVDANVNYNILGEDCDKQPDNNANESFNWDSLAKDLLDIVDVDELSKVANECPIAPEPEIKYIVPESQPAPAFLPAGVNVMDLNLQQMDCFLNNGNIVQESGQAGGENLRDSVQEFMDHLKNLNGEP